MTDSEIAMTVGSFAATVLTEAIKAGIGESIKDAYNGLKAKVIQWSGSDMEEIERGSMSTEKQEIIAQAINRQALEDQASVQKLALRLSTALEQAAATGATAYDIKKLKAARINFEKIKITEGTTILKAEEVETLGDFNVKDLTVSTAQKKS